MGSKRKAKVKVSELSGAALDWAVAKAEGDDHWTSERNADWFAWRFREWKPSSDWAQCGPLIDKYKVSIVYHNAPDRTPLAVVHDMHPQFEYGETVLIAACRAIVASVLGDEVEVPEGLVP